MNIHNPFDPIEGAEGLLDDVRKQARQKMRDHYSKDDKKWKNVSNAIHSMRIDTIVDDNEYFHEMFLKKRTELMKESDVRNASDIGWADPLFSKLQQVYNSIPKINGEIDSPCLKLSNESQNVHITVRRIVRDILDYDTINKLRTWMGDDAKNILSDLIDDETELDNVKDFLTVYDSDHSYGGPDEALAVYASYPPWYSTWEDYFHRLFFPLISYRLDNYCIRGEMPRTSATDVRDFCSSILMAHTLCGHDFPMSPAERCKQRRDPTFIALIPVLFHMLWSVSGGTGKTYTKHKYC